MKRGVSFNSRFHISFLFTFFPSITFQEPTKSRDCRHDLGRRVAVPTALHRLLLVMLVMLVVAVGAVGAVATVGERGGTEGEGRGRG